MGWHRALSREHRVRGARCGTRLRSFVRVPSLGQGQGLLTSDVSFEPHRLFPVSIPLLNKGSSLHNSLLVKFCNERPVHQRPSPSYCLKINSCSPQASGGVQTAPLTLDSQICGLARQWPPTILAARRSVAYWATRASSLRRCRAGGPPAAPQHGRPGPGSAPDRGERSWPRPRAGRPPG
jgi:hypothetical protein